MLIRLARPSCAEEEPRRGGVDPRQKRARHRQFGRIVNLAQGLPMTYNRDLQEDKERLFDTVDTVRATVRLCAAMLRNIEVNGETCLAAAQDPVLLGDRFGRISGA